MAARSRLTNRFVQTLPWAAFEGGTSVASGLLMTLVIGRTLGAADVGRAGLALSTVALVEVASAAGIQEAVVRARSGHTTLTDSAYWLCIALSLVGMTACLGCGVLLSWAYGDALVLPLTAVASLSLLFNAAAAVPTGTFTRKMRAAALASRLAIGKLAGLLALIALALLDTGPWSIVVSYVAGTLAGVIAILWTAARFPRPRFRRDDLRGLVSFGSLYSLEAILWTAALRLFGFTFGYFHGLNDYGALQFAFRLVDDLATLIQRTILRFGLSYFAALSRSNDNSRGAFLQGSRLLTVLATPIFTGIALTAPDLVVVGFGARWLVAVPMIQVIAFSWIFGFPRSLVGPILRAEGKQAILVRYAGAMCVFTIGGAFVTSHSSATVATLAFCLRQVLAVPWGLLVIRREIGVTIRDQLTSMQFGALGLLAMAVAVLALQTAMGGAAPGLRLAASAMTGAVVYTATLLALDHELRRLAAMALHRLAARVRLRTPGL